MIKQKLAAVLIPFYKENLTELESISLAQAVRILSKYDIYLVMPDSLMFSTECKISKQRFSDDYFDSRSSYNRLMLSTEFYQCFTDYKYILVYQLDAFVFSDRLEYFCGLDYDYIGAPWIDGEFYYKDIRHMIWHVGNGGFSLRKVDSFLNILKENQDLLANNRMNEDLFFSVLDSESFHIAPENVALEFSFEMKVRECYARNRNRLPFGCHAWQKFDLPFWKPLVEDYGYTLPEEICKEGQGDADYLVSSRRKEITYFWTKSYKKEDLKLLIPQLFSSRNEEYAIWGAGYWGQMLYNILNDAGIMIQVFIDSQKALKDCQIYGHNIIMPENLARMKNKYRVIVGVTSGYDDIASALNSMDYQYQRDYIFFRDIDMIYKNVII